MHLGHEGAVRDLLAATRCDRLHVVPAAQPPHRVLPGASAVQRAAMLDLAFAADAAVRVDRRELERDGPSWTVDTLESLRAEYGPTCAIAFVLGTDALAGLARWHRPDALLELAHLIVLGRPGAPWPEDAGVAELLAGRRVGAVDALYDAPAGMVCDVHQRPVDVSATQVRAALAEPRAGRDPHAVDRLLSSAVSAYIRRHGLYGAVGPVPGATAERE